MKLKSLFLICSSTIFLMAPLAANAGLITGTFKGIVLASEDSADYSWEGVDVWNGDLAGQDCLAQLLYRARLGNILRQRLVRRFLCKFRLLQQEAQ